MSLLAFLALRYPVRLLPILLFESLWKIIWLAVVALPKVVANELDPATQDVAFSCLFVVIILAVVPWRYVWQHYLTAKGDRHRRSRGAAITSPPRSRKGRMQRKITLCAASSGAY